MSTPGLLIRIRIRIDFGRLEPEPAWECGSDSNPGGQKLPTKTKKPGEMYFFVMDVLLLGLEASPVAWGSFREA
jgi:hypothetical protein